MSVVTLPSMPKLRSMLPSALKRARMKSVKVPPTMTILPSACSAMPERSPPKRSSVALPAMPKLVSRPLGSGGGGGRSSSTIVSTARRLRAERRAAARLRQREVHRLVRLDDCVGDDRHADDARRRVAVAEEDGGVDRRVVGAGDRRAVAGGERGGDGAAAAAGAGDGDVVQAARRLVGREARGAELQHACGRIGPRARQATRGRDGRLTAASDPAGWSAPGR